MASRRFSFTRMGYSFRLTELEGALGVAELQQKDINLKNRLGNAQYLIRNLSKYSNFIQLPSWPSYAGHAFMMFPIVIKDSRVKRDDLITYLEKNGVETRYMLPLLNQPFYKKLFGNLESQYPVAKWINNNGFYIGCHQTLTKGDLGYVVGVFEEFFKKWI